MNAQTVSHHGDNLWQINLTPETSQTCSNEPLLIRVNGKIYLLTAKALQSYLADYGFEDPDEKTKQECIEHIVSELRVALSRPGKCIGRRARIVQHDSPSLVFKLIGSKIVGLRISLKYNPSEPSMPANFLPATK